MNFNEVQSKEIYDFIMRYNSEENFNKNIQELYNNEPGQLSILHIYAVEEVLRFGTKELFNKFLETKGIYTVEQAVEQYNGFMKLLTEDADFNQYKKDQLNNSPETLSAMEMFAFSLINKPKNEKEPIQEEATEELESDPLNPILFSYDKQIRETLGNLFFGELIHEMLDLPAMKSIKDRQKANGRIASIDKPIIIKKIQGVISSQDSMSQFKQVIDQRYIKVKMDLLLGKGEAAFEQYLKFNTNITANEIFGIEKDTTVDDMYANLKDMINSKKATGGRFTQDDAMDLINKMREEGKGKPKR